MGNSWIRALCLCFFGSIGAFEWGARYELPSEENDGVRSLVMLSTSHRQKPETNRVHRSIFYDCVRSSAVLGGLRGVVEDAFAYKGSNSCIRGRLLALACEERVGVLGGLYTCCNLHSVLCTGVEHRFERVAALAPIIANERKKRPAQQCDPYGIKSRSVVQEVCDVIDEVKSYDDSPELNAYYDEVVGGVAKQSDDILTELEHFDGTVGAYIYSVVPPEKRLAFAYSLLLFDASLVDAQIVHHAVQGDNLEDDISIVPTTTFVAAGSRHCWQVERALQKCAGAEKVYEVGSQKGGEYKPLSFNVFQLPDRSAYLGGASQQRCTSLAIDDLRELLSTKSH